MVKVTVVDSLNSKVKQPEPFDVYRHIDNETYVALEYGTGIRLHNLSDNGNVWIEHSTFGQSESMFTYVGKLTEITVTR